MRSQFMGHCIQAVSFKSSLATGLGGNPSLVKHMQKTGQLRQLIFMYGGIFNFILKWDDFHVCVTCTVFIA